MPIIKLLVFYFLFSLPFVICAEQKEVNLDFPEYISTQEINELCSKFYNPEYKTYDHCLTDYTSFDVSITDTTDMITACGAYSTAGMIECLETKAEYNQIILNKTEQKMNDLLPELFSSKIFYFSISSKTFAMYRDMQCDFEGVLFGGGLRRHMISSACVAASNNERILQLRKLMSALVLNKKEKEKK